MFTCGVPSRIFSSNLKSPQGVSVGASTRSISLNGHEFFNMAPEQVRRTSEVEFGAIPSNDGSDWGCQDGCVVNYGMEWDGKGK